LSSGFSREEKGWNFDQSLLEFSIVLPAAQ
jgi:hypothetical protein